VNKLIRNIIRDEVKKLIKEGAIRQWVLGEDGPNDMFLKIPQETEKTKRNKGHFEHNLKINNLDFDWIADDEMDEYSHYLIYNDIPPDVLEFFQSTFNAEVVNQPNEDASL